METSACCFIGHRKIQDKERVFLTVKKTVERLVEKGVKTFLFGSKSEFDDICHFAVTELQSKYPDIIRINYNRKSEYAVTPSEKADCQESLGRLLNKDIRLKDYEKSKMSDRIWRAGKASYVERNEDMVNDSEYCVFYYKEEYEIEANPYYKSSGKSGTKLAYDYAVRKKKNIINIAGII